ncbi:bifunctional adenosylcobinamide kinase/adenosylcobinamide-phosphate guanylyltransferase [Vibrio sp. S9_S30]|uniref:bifunctional adenosylcobinamide kinase/adenosylcobinamide-phosphate guanylyltransferase n=1 Tax=Vibrio sp. S9_S30 TaxID=2720226 RepID=UPI001681B64C|nr:bifunctional adenosylcobinamide kinase/adenosylcobinamide-phosphate guanylyltransferase [Vibrio sp. S9_S30]MBD1556745.1 bifunctional adenosylcobinamide kinase/adenosylcobinamide-phosphate guanylyltransferase [Vibrio sp. S9_S30]
MNKHHLILGGARSGKSTYAEQCVQEMANAYSLKKIYIATAISFDEEMSQRIDIHQERRGESWDLIEEPLNLAVVIQALDEDCVVLLDCLTLWLNNVLFKLGDEAADSQVHENVAELVHAITASRCRLVIVSNEVGMGIVPLGKVSRLFVDHAGWMNQKMATVCSKVTFVAAGLPLSLKS